MRRVLSWAVGYAALCLASGMAHAQTALRGAYEPVTLGDDSLPLHMALRFWISEGSTGFAIDSSVSNPALGSPTSVLNYGSMVAKTAEFAARYTTPGGTFFKGYVGGGTQSNGTLDDEDFAAGQIKFSDTSSTIDDGTMAYGTLDVGHNFYGSWGGRQYALSPFAGATLWHESVNANGLVCNPDDVDGAICGAPGDEVFPASLNVITNEANWVAVRLGVEMRAQLSPQLAFGAEVAFVPIAHVQNDDSHHLRDDLGAVPNIASDGSGSGLQFESTLTWHATSDISLNGGVRYWRLNASGETVFGPNTSSPSSSTLSDFSSERTGVFADISYRFGVN